MYFFVVNSMSGNGKGRKVWNRIEPLLQHRQIDYRVEFSESAAHAASVVRQLAAQESERTVLVVVGGDGTLQSVIPALIGGAMPLGMIPAGSGNDFARALGIPLRPEKALDYLVKGEVRVMDIAQTGSKCCVTVIGIGIDGKVAQTVNERRLRKRFKVFRPGRLTYALSLLQVLSRYRTHSVELTVDGKKHTFSGVWLIAVANFPNYGGGMRICPVASCADGVFDICVVHGISRFRFLRIFPYVFAGKHVLHSGVSMLRGKEVKVASSSPMVAHGDGEVIGHTPMEITLLKDAVRVIYNGFGGRKRQVDTPRFP